MARRLIHNRTATIGRQMFSHRTYLIAIAIVSIFGFLPTGSRCSDTSCRIEEEPVSLYECELIVVATYKSAQKSERKPECWNTLFEKVGELKGPNMANWKKYSKSINIEICEEASSALPQKNSKWILFFPTFMPNDTFYTTFQGKDGRIPLSATSFSEAAKQIRLVNAKYGRDNELLNRFVTENEALTK